MLTNRALNRVMHLDSCAAPSSRQPEPAATDSASWQVCTRSGHPVSTRGWANKSTYCCVLMTQIFTFYFRDEGSWVPARLQREICHVIVEAVTKLGHTQHLLFCPRKKVKNVSLQIDIALFQARDTVPGEGSLLRKLSKKILPVSEKVGLVCWHDDYTEELEPIRT